MTASGEGQYSMSPCFRTKMVRTKNIAEKSNHNSKVFYFFLGSIVCKFKLLILFTHSIWVMATLINLNYLHKLKQVRLVNILSLTSKPHLVFIILKQCQRYPGQLHQLKSKVQGFFQQSKYFHKRNSYWQNLEKSLSLRMLAFEKD